MKLNLFLIYIICVLSQNVSNNTNNINNIIPSNEVQNNFHQNLLKNFTCKPFQSGYECSYHGVCHEDGRRCICFDGYTTSSNFFACDYKQKNSMFAFSAEIPFGFLTGAGYFILGLNSMGIGQILYFWIGLILCGILCVAKYIEDDNINNSGCCFLMFYCFSFFWSIGVLVWWIYALVTISNGSLVDTNGILIPSLYF